MHKRLEVILNHEQAIKELTEQGLINYTLHRDLQMYKLYTSRRGDKTHYCKVIAKIYKCTAHNVRDRLRMLDSDIFKR